MNSLVKTVSTVGVRTLCRAPKCSSYFHTIRQVVCKPFKASFTPALTSIMPARAYSMENMGEREQPPPVVVGTEDVNITCVDCQTQFSFSVAEQQFYAEREFSQPHRCKGCRDKRKAAKFAARRDGGFNDRGSFGGGRQGGPRGGNGGRRGRDDE